MYKQYTSNKKTRGDWENVFFFKVYTAAAVETRSGSFRCERPFTEREGLGDSCGFVVTQREEQWVQVKKRDTRDETQAVSLTSYILESLYCTLRDLGTVLQDVLYKIIPQKVGEAVDWIKLRKAQWGV